MYLAPLNYDRFFKKVFNDPEIARSFLEDFLDVEIEEIEKLDDKHRVTDDAAVVEFDYRCKIDDYFVIIDMQQWYKTDVIKRFYLYHCLNSGLQLEKLPEKLAIPEKSIKSEHKKQRDYEYIEPVYTLIWMVDDTLGFTDDYAQYSMNHESVIEFIHNDELWQNKELKLIVEQREKVIENLVNNTKNIQFLSLNKLVFMFQKNIVLNMEDNREHKKYKRWFDFAMKTRNKENTKDDFMMFEDDSVFKEVMKRLKKDDLNEDDIQYIEEEDEFLRLALDYYHKQNKKIKKSKEEGIAQGIEQGIAQERDRQEEMRRKEKMELARKMLSRGLSINDVCDITGLSEDDVKKLI